VWSVGGLFSVAARQSSSGKARLVRFDLLLGTSYFTSRQRRGPATSGPAENVHSTPRPDHALLAPQLGRLNSAISALTGVRNDGYSCQAQTVRSSPCSDRRCSTRTLGESQGRENRSHRQPPKAQAVRHCTSPHQSGSKSSWAKWRKEHSKAQPNHYAFLSRDRRSQ